MMASVKRTRVTSPAREPPTTPKELLESRLNSLVDHRHDMSAYFSHLSQPAHFYKMSDPVLVDCNGPPPNWLPEEFAKVERGGETRLAFGNRLVSLETTTHVHACVKTTAIAGSAYYLGKDGLALVIPRSSTDPTGINFEHKRIKFVMGDVGQAELLSYVSTLLAEANPPPQKALYLLSGLRDAHRTKNSKKVLDALRAPSGSTPAAHLATLLSSQDRFVPSIASNLLACMRTNELLEDILNAAEECKIEVQILYNLLTGDDFSLPIRTFSKGQGYDSGGRELEARKLSECSDHDEVITSTKVVTLSNFKSLSDRSFVFVKPAEGMFRKGPRKDKRDTYVEMSQVTVVDAASLRRYGKAIQGACGNVRAEPMKPDEEKEIVLIEGEEL
jgi:hypothetical protein